MGYKYRNGPAYAEVTTAQQIAEDDADDLRAPIQGMPTQIGLLEILVSQVATAIAEDALAAAIGHLEEAIGELQIAANRVVDECED